MNPQENPPLDDAAFRARLDRAMQRHAATQPAYWPVGYIAEAEQLRTQLTTARKELAALNGKLGERGGTIFELAQENARIRSLHHTPYVDAEHQGGNCVDVLMAQAAEIARLTAELVTAREELVKRDADRPTTADCSECGLSWSFRCCPDCGAPARVSSPEPEGPSQPDARIDQQTTSDPRVWREGDPAPEDGPDVIDDAGAVWQYEGDGIWACHAQRAACEWSELFEQTNTLTEVRTTALDAS
jgi:hypothetical protein